MLKLSSRQGIFRAFVAVVAVAAACFLWADKATAAPLTVETLIGQAVSDSGGPQYQDVADAIVRFQNGDVAASRDLLERARKKNSKLPPAEMMLGRMWLAAGQLNNARGEFENAAHLYPNDPDAFLIFGEIAMADRRITDAESLFLRAKTLADAFTENAKRQRNFQIRANSGLASVSEAHEQYDAMVQFLKAWLQLDADSSPAHQLLGRAYFRQGNDGDAYKEFQTASKNDPEANNPDIAMAFLYETTKKTAQAEKFILAAVKKNPGSLKVQMEAAGWAFQTNHLSDALAYADAAMKIDPKSIDAMVLRAKIARMQGDYKTAETLLNVAHEKAPSNLDAANQLALVLADQNDTTKRQQALELADINRRATNQGDQFNSEALTTLAWIYYKMGRLPDAEKLIGAVLQRGAINTDSAYYAAKILQDGGHNEEAIKLLQAAVNSSAPFIMRQNATDLLAQINVKKPETPASK